MDPVYRPGAIPFPNSLRDERVALRAWTDDDLHFVEEASLDPVIPTGTTVPSPFTGEAGLAFIERQHHRWASGEGLSLAITDLASDCAVGFITLLHRQQPGVAGVGYGIVASRRRQRFASTALRLLRRWALDLPSFHRLEALVEPGNVGSLRVLGEVGFQPEGVLRRYLDIGGERRDAWLYSLLNDDVTRSAS
jgi:ribosomal-protein-alanine N-acetyltransferase